MTAAAANRSAKIERPPREEFAKAWMDPDITQRQVAKIFGVSRTTCGVIAAEYGLPYRSRFSNCIGISNKNAADPTPEQIAERAAEIRKNWSSAERQRRMLGGRARPSIMRLSLETSRLVG